MPGRRCTGGRCPRRRAPVDGLTVSEIWDTRADYDAFFDEHIKPKLPQAIPTPASTPSPTPDGLGDSAAVHPSRCWHRGARWRGPSSDAAWGGVFEVLNAATATILVGVPPAPPDMPSGVLGGAWSWTRSKLGELTHRSEKADAGGEDDDPEGLIGESVEHHALPGRPRVRREPLLHSLPFVLGSDAGIDATSVRRGVMGL